MQNLNITKWLQFIMAFLMNSFGVTDDVHSFYQLTGRQVAWTGDSCRANLEQLAAYVDQAPYLGLRDQQYEPALLDSLIIEKSYHSDTLLDKRLTRAALLFFSDVVYGQRLREDVNYNGPRYSPRCYEPMARMLANSFLQHQFGELLYQLEPRDSVYQQFKALIAIIHRQLADSNFKETRFPRKLTDIHEPGFMDRLYQLGARRAADTVFSLKQIQKMFGLLADGVLSTSVIDAVNVPLKTRQEQLRQAINCYRWIQCAQQSAPSVIVNIPSNSLSVYFKDSCLLSSRVIVGKPSTPTPILCSRIQAIVLYPYWYVPHKIAVRELLPRIKANISYLEDNQLQILSASGRIISPARINWPEMNAANFPYTLRQNIGCDNSMGVIKLDFESPYGVYLHDTPQKGLFLLKQRFFSHGCVRVEKADTLARLLSSEQRPIVARLLDAGPAVTQKPITIPLDTRPWIYIFYNIVWPDEQGLVRFFSDSYHHYPLNN